MIKSELKIKTQTIHFINLIHFITGFLHIASETRFSAPFAPFALRFITTAETVTEATKTTIKAQIIAKTNGEAPELEFASKHCVFGPVTLVTPSALPAAGAVYFPSPQAEQAATPASALY